MGVSINIHKSLGVGVHTHIVPPLNTSAFDTTSWALAGGDDHLRNTVPYTTIAADDSSASPSGAKWSVVFWAKLDAISGTQYLYDIRDAAGALVQNLYVISTGQLRAFMTGNSSNWSRSASGAVTAGNWHLISMTYDSAINRYDRQKVWVDADRTGETSNFLAANHPQSNNITLGATSAVGSTMEGHLNEIAIWYGTALTQAQLEAIYNSGGPALNLDTINGVPSPTNWFRSENAAWSGPDPGGEHYLMDDETGSGNKIRTNNMPEASREQDVPT